MRVYFGFFAGIIHMLLTSMDVLVQSYVSYEKQTQETTTKHKGQVQETLGLIPDKEKDKGTGSKSSQCRTPLRGLCEGYSFGRDKTVVESG